MLRIYQIASLLTLLLYTLVMVLMIYQASKSQRMQIDDLMVFVAILTATIASGFFLWQSFKILGHNKPTLPEMDTLDAPVEAEEKPQRHRLGLGWVTGSINLLAGLVLLVLGIYLLVESIDRRTPNRMQYFLGMGIISYITLYGALQIYGVIAVFVKVIKSRRKAPEQKKTEAMAN